MPTGCPKSWVSNSSSKIKPGAGGTIAGGMAAKAPKDGYTVLAISMGHSVSAVMVKQVPYDPVNDFAPVGIFTNSAFVVVVPKNSPATDIKSLIEYVNKQPGKLNYSTVGLGSTQHLIAEHLRQRASINAQAVSYRTTGEVVSALLRGDAAYRRRTLSPNSRTSGFRRSAGHRGGDAEALAGDPECADARGERHYRELAISAGTVWRSRPARRNRSSTSFTRR